MSTTAQPFAMVENDFADGTYKFGLTWALASEWEKTTGRSLYGTLVTVLRTGVAALEDTRELIRLGLIGGGTKPTDALRLVRTYVEERPASENFGLVVDIVDAFYHGKSLTAGAPVADAENEPEPAVDG